MAEIVLHPTSQQIVTTYLKRPAHGLLLSGVTGIGLMTIARHIASKLSSTSVRDVIPDEKGTITIETIRGLYRLTRTHRDEPLVIIIDDADAMGREAQNALLKLLEEPVENVYFILTSHAPQRLLATILSRVQHVALLPITAEQSAKLIVSDAAKAQLLFLGQGLPAELYRLQNDERYFEQQSNQMKAARNFLEGSAYDRLLLAKEYGADRQSAGQFLDAVTRLLSFMILTKQQPQLVNSLEKVTAVRERLEQNAHVKTQLTYLVTALGSSGTMST